MLFKGTDQFGTSNYEKEKPYLDEIENLFEAYRNTKEEDKRKKIYHTIDSLSGVAAKYAIANEYDKMMAAIGGEKSNAYTWLDQTVYHEQFPANQAVNWLRIQSERFRNPIMRIFHTELEAVYEEKNMSLDDDNDKVMETLFAELFKHHTYGTQTTIGTIDHLKNPSIKEIKNFYKKYYVPNNMGLALVGDFNPDEMIKSVSLAFASMVKVDVPQPEFKPEEEIKKPIEKNVVGPEAESLTIGFRFGGASTSAPAYLQLITELLYNGKAGLFDENITNAQKALQASAYNFLFNDYSILFLEGRNKDGQKLEEVKDLLLNELKKLSSGAITQEQLNAAKTNLTLKNEKLFDNIDSRASIYVDALVKKQTWANYWESFNRYKTITPQELTNFCKTFLKDNYVVVYKRMGNDDNVAKVTKPAITPVEVNSTAKSDFFTNLESFPVTPAEPVFTDFNKSIIKQKCQNQQELWQVPNNNNSLFKFYIALPYGSLDEPLLNLAFNYLKLSGSTNKSANELQKELYAIGSSWRPTINKHLTLIEISGLSENFTKTLNIIYEWFNNPASNKTVFDNQINDYIKELQDLKTDKRTLLWEGLANYAQYGAEFKNQIFLTSAKAKALQISDLKAVLSKTFSSSVTYMFYGKTEADIVAKQVNATFGKNTNNAYTSSIKLKPSALNQNQVYFLNYEMNQADLLWLSSLNNFSPDMLASGTLYNEYFGGGMASIVFQTLRESKALAYSAKSIIQFPERKTDAFYNIAFMGTQADKLKEATAGMQDLLKQMPKTETTFDVAKKVQIQKIISNPLVKENLLLQHYAWSQQDITNDFRETLYNYLEQADLSRLNSFHTKTIKPLKYNLLVVGNKNKIDFKILEKYGNITELNANDIFGE